MLTIVKYGNFSPQCFIFSKAMPLAVSLVRVEWCADGLYMNIQGALK